MNTKGLTISVIAAMCIVMLSIGPAAAYCGGYVHWGYVFDKNGDPVGDITAFQVVNITNENTGTTWTKQDFELADNAYSLTTTAAIGDPDPACAWNAGDVVRYDFVNEDGTQTNTTWHNMTAYEIAVGIYKKDIYLEALPLAEETFTKKLSKGWNLISLPLEPTAGNESTSKVLETVSYDAVYLYDADSHSFVDVSGGTMESGVGYFVHVTNASTWTYNGTAYTDMNIALKQGLNMVGWLNCSKDIVSDNALLSIDGNYYYVASWNASEQKFETYNPVAPNGFNDFSDMERGEGYFISAKVATTLSESC